MKQKPHLLILGMASILWACGGGGGAPAAGGGAVTASSSSGGSAISSSSGGSKDDPKLPFLTETLSQAINKDTNPFRSQQLMTSGRDIIRNLSISTPTSESTQSIAIVPVTQNVSPVAGDNVTTYKITFRDVEFTSSASDDNATLRNGTSTLKSLDGKWNALLNGTNTNSFKYLRRFEVQTPDRVRYGAFGIRTNTGTNSIADVLQNSGAAENTMVTYSGMLDGQFSERSNTSLSGNTSASRTATFAVNLSNASIRATLGGVTGATGFDTVSLTGNGAISGNRFTITELAVAPNSSFCTANASACPDKFVKSGSAPVVVGHFYGARAQELGGAITYEELKGKNALRHFTGAFGATRPTLSGEE